MAFPIEFDDVQTNLISWPSFATGQASTTKGQDRFVFRECIQGAQAAFELFCQQNYRRKFLHHRALLFLPAYKQDCEGIAGQVLLCAAKGKTCPGITLQDLTRILGGGDAMKKILIVVMLALAALGRVQRI